MKKTLYELLELKPEATQTEIDHAYAVAKTRLQPAIDRADADALNLSRLLKDGYRILSDPERRARYDASIQAQAQIERSQLVYESVGSTRIGLGVVITLLLLVAGGIWVHLKLLDRAENIRVEYAEAVRQKQAEKEKAQTTTIEGIPVPQTAPGIERELGKP